jgi:hypothetical protein
MGEMLSLLPEYATGEFDSRHRLVIVAAQRAKQLVQGARMSGGVQIHQRNEHRARRSPSAQGQIPDRTGSPRGH